MFKQESVLEDLAGLSHLEIIAAKKKRKDFLTWDLDSLAEKPRGKLLNFNLPVEYEGLSVYNPSPMMIGGELFLLGRVENKSSEKASFAMLFSEAENGDWDAVEGAPIIQNLQDPFYCGVIGGFRILGGVRTWEVPGEVNARYRTVFYFFKEFFQELVDRPVDEIGSGLKPDAIGPIGMKGVRLLQRKNGKIGVFTRPQGNDFGGRGKIGYFEIDRLDQLETRLEYHVQGKNPEELISGIFLLRARGEDEWGGVNEVYNLPDDRIGVLAHIADFDPNSNKKSYYPIYFIFNPDTMTVSGLKILATAQQFPDLVAKMDQLGSVFYGCGIVWNKYPDPTLIGGVGDIAGGKVAIHGVEKPEMPSDFDLKVSAEIR